MKSIPPDPTRQQPAEAFILELVALDRIGPPPIVRLRQFLKWSLRAAGFRCRALRPIDPGQGDGR